MTTPAEFIEYYAMSNRYTGPVAPGMQFAGWPLTALTDVLLKRGNNQVDVAQAIMALKLKYPMMHPQMQVVQPAKAYMHIEMLAMRMRWPTGQCTGFEHVAVHAVGDDVHVWVVTKNSQSTTFVDGAALFPSDALVTKLNLLKQE